MEENTQHFWHIVFYYFKKGKNAIEMQKKCAVYEEDAVTDLKRQKWFVKFHAGDFSLDNVPQSVHPLKFIVIKLIHLLRTTNVLPHGRWPTYSKYLN